MNKKTKRFLVSALIIFAVGSLIALGSYIFAVASDLDIYGNSERTYDFDSFTLTLDELKSQTNTGDQDIVQLQINTQAANVRVLRTDGVSQIEFHRMDRNNLILDFNAGILSVTEPNSVNYYGLTVENGSFSFHGLRHLFHQAGFQTGHQIVVLLNPNDTLSALHLNSTAGNVLVDGVDIAADLTIASTAGNIKVLNSNSPGADLVVRLSAGKIDYRDSTFSIAALNVTAGQIEAERFGGSLSAEAVAGRIRVCADKDLESYSIRAVTSLGNVHIADQGAVGGTYHLSTGENITETIALECTVGPIYLEKINS